MKAFLLLLHCMCLLFTIAGAQVSRHDVLITEIMADPSPVVGLPNGEFVEIKNVSGQAINLMGWKLADVSGAATINANVVLQPDSMLILCSNSNLTLFAAFTRAIGLSSFPSLDNDGDLLSLRSATGLLIHAVEYTTALYGNALKKEGGWSLEMIDTSNPCGAGNWTASKDVSGGTPGRINSVAGNNKDEDPPRLLRTYSPDSLTLIAVFDEPLDSAGAADHSRYVLNGQTIIAAVPRGPLFREVLLRLAAPLPLREVFQLQVASVDDCSGNQIGSYNTVQAGRAEPAGKNDVVINEILFDPPPSGFDFVELYNRSGKIIDASQLYLANRDGQGAIASVKKISSQPFNLYPGSYLVVTEQPYILQGQYFVKDPLAVLELASMPSFPNDKGTVVLLDHTGEVVDEVAYHEDWHFALMQLKEGVSLERIHPDAASLQQNWHSAASSAGFATPAAVNSQYRSGTALTATISITPATISPDNDGWDDIAAISYAVIENGYVANVFIMDAGGRTVRKLVNNALLGLQGIFYWDGLGNSSQQLQPGIYIICTEIFNLQGKRKLFRNTVVLAKNL